MSNHEVFYQVAEALRGILFDAVKDEPQIYDIVTPTQIVFLNPTETAREERSMLSIWLYQVTENADLKNQLPLRVSETGTKNPPLALNLSFLVTPFAQSSESNQQRNLLLLGKTMQVLYDNAIVLLRYGEGEGEEEFVEELRIILCRLSLEEQTRIWEALKEPYRLSICYQVQVTRIDSERVTGSRRILERQTWLGEEIMPEGGERA